MTALAAENLAVVTGAASGIGLAAAQAFVNRGMRVVLVDLPGDAIGKAASQIGSLAIVMPADVADRGDVLADSGAWDRLLSVNLMGVVHGVQAFVPAMIAGNAPGIVINTGSKQGITQPPGNTAYNVSKAGVKALTEGLGHTLRQQTGARISAHLLIPGFTYTGMTAARVATQPPGAWSPHRLLISCLQGLQPVISTCFVRITRRRRNRIADELLGLHMILIENRPALSRWHPGWREALARFMATGSFAGRMGALLAGV